MAMKEVDILGSAMAATENEIFGEAFGKEEMVLDESGDRSVEEMGEGLEGQHEPEGDDEDEGSGSEAEGEEEDAEAEAETVAEATTKPKEPVVEPPVQHEGRVPAGRLREQTEKVKAAAAERDALKAEREAEKLAHRKEIEALNAKVDTFLTVLQRQQPAQPVAKVETPEVPDLFEDPKAFLEHLNKGFEAKLQERDRRIEDMRIETSMQSAHARHGEAFPLAYQALVNLDRSNPDNLQTGQRILAAPNPGEALMQWHRRNEAFRRVGENPEKYEESIREKARNDLMKDPDFRKQLLADLQAEAATGDHGTPRTITRLPKSLNGASGNNSGRGDASYGDDSDSSVFNSAFT